MTRLLALVDRSGVAERECRARAFPCSSRRQLVLGRNGQVGDCRPELLWRFAAAVPHSAHRASRARARPGRAAARRAPRARPGAAGTSKAVATPKLPPPPCSAQNRSGFSSALARHPRAVGRHQLDRDQVVARQAVLALEPAGAAAERQARDARRRHAPARGGEAVLLGGAVDLGPRAAAPDAGGAGARDRPRSTFIGRTSITSPPSFSDMPATEWPPVAPRSRGPARCPNASAAATSSGLCALRDQRRPPVDHRVEERARLVVGRVVRASQRSPEPRDACRVSSSHPSTSSVVSNQHEHGQRGEHDQHHVTTRSASVAGAHAGWAGNGPPRRSPSRAPHRRSRAADRGSRAPRRAPSAPLRPARVRSPSSSSTSDASVAAGSRRSRPSMRRDTSRKPGRPGRRAQPGRDQHQQPRARRTPQARHRGRARRSARIRTRPGRDAAIASPTRTTSRSPRRGRPREREPGRDGRQQHPFRARKQQRERDRRRERDRARVESPPCARVAAVPARGVARAVRRFARPAAAARGGRPGPAPCSRTPPTRAGRRRSRSARRSCPREAAASSSRSSRRCRCRRRSRRPARARRTRRRRRSARAGSWRRRAPAPSTEPRASSRPSSGARQRLGERHAERCRAHDRDRLEHGRDARPVAQRAGPALLARRAPGRRHPRSAIQKPAVGETREARNDAVATCARPDGSRPSAARGGGCCRLRCSWYPYAERL